jgi:hypothetical protein
MAENSMHRQVARSVAKRNCGSKEAANRDGHMKSSRYKTLRYVSEGLIILIIFGGLLFFLQYPEKLDALLDWMVGRR